MLPSEFPEVQSRAGLKRLLSEHIDMQFVDVRTMLRLPLADIAGGCALISRILKIVRRIRQLPALGLAGGCRREERDFRNGGPSAGHVNWEQESKPANDFAGATGPLTGMEKKICLLLPMP